MIVLGVASLVFFLFNSRCHMFNKWIEKYDFKIPLLNSERKVVKGFYGLKKFREEELRLRKERTQYCIGLLPLGLCCVFYPTGAKILFLLIVYYRVFFPLYKLKSLLKKRTDNFYRIYPIFLSRLKLSLESGLTLENALFEMQFFLEQDYYLELINQARQQISCGLSRKNAYMEIAQKAVLRELVHLVYFFIAIVDYGLGDSNHIAYLLEESWRLKKDNTKKLGEEASGKMVIPMIGIFLAVILLTIGPSMLLIFK